MHCMNNFGVYKQLRHRLQRYKNWKKKIEMFVDKQRFPLTLYITCEIYDRAERNTITEVRAPGKRVPWRHSGNIECSLEFYLHYAFIHVERPQRAGGVHVRVPKKTGRMLGASIQEGRLARLRGAA